jgi:hypothetical protein
VPQANGKITKKHAGDLVAVAPIEAVREVFGKRKVIGYVLEAVTGRLVALPPEEKNRLGLKMMPGKKMDYIRDVKGAFAELSAFGVPEDELWNCLSFNKTDLLTAIRAMTICSEAQTEQIYETKLDPFIERGTAKESLAEV